jgi:hypothetical protein
MLTTPLTIVPSWGSSRSTSRFRKNTLEKFQSVSSALLFFLGVRTFFADTLNVSKRDQDLSVQNNTAVISIDGADIFTIKGINLHRVKDNKLIRDERLDNENFKLAWNKTWGLSVDLFKAVFPYEHNYADAVQNEFVSVFKWLKIVHNRKKIPFTASSPLPSDLFINVKEFLFEMSDDPFEVKLRDNFELLEDEYNESLKRQKMLKEKVAELCKTHLHLPAGKVEELYNNLKKKNAEIYIQRSKQMLRAVPPRTRLFAWNMTNMEIMVLDCINSNHLIAHHQFDMCQFAAPSVVCVK